MTITKAILIATCLLFTLCTCCYSQHTFIRHYSKESVIGFRIRQHDDGSYRLFSRYNPTGTNINSTITSINEYGDSTGLIQFGVPEDEFVEDVLLEGNRYIMAGARTKANGYTEPMLLKLNSQDTSDHSYHFYTITTRDAVFWNILPSGDYYYLVGGKYANDTNGYDVSITKTDTNGNIIWDKNYGYNLSDRANGAILTQDGGVLVVGRRFRIPGGGKKIYVVKIDSAGNEQWSRTIGNPGDTLDDCSLEANSVVQAANGNYYIAGYNDNWCSEYANRGSDASILLCLDSMGNQLWMWQDQFEIKWFPAPNDTVFQQQNFSEIELTSDGNILCAGNIDLNINNNPDSLYSPALLVKFDLSGNLIWKKYYGEEGYNNYVYDLIRTQDNGYALCGRYEDVDHPSTGVKSFVIKTNECGCISGCDATCETLVGIEKEQVRKNILKLYPNPATDRLSIESIEHFTLIEVKDILGRVLITLDHPQQNQIDVSALTKGIYFVSAYTKEREVYNATFVKE